MENEIRNEKGQRVLFRLVQMEDEPLRCTEDVTCMYDGIEDDGLDDVLKSAGVRMASLLSCFSNAISAAMCAVIDPIKNEKAEKKAVDDILEKLTDSIRECCYGVLNISQDDDDTKDFIRDILVKMGKNGGKLS